MQKLKILYFMPDNPIKKDAGNKARALQLLEYFDSRTEFIDVNFVSEKYWGQWEHTDILNFKKIFPNIKLDVLSRKISKNNKLKYLFKYKVPNIFKRNLWLISPPSLPDNNTIQLQNGFNSILRNNRFDYVIISYVTWSSLVKKNPYLNKAKLINDTHDFMTAQNKLKRNFNLGSSFEKEINMLSLFDELWSVSNDERYLFSQFITAKNRFVPIMYDAQYLDNIKPNHKEFDLLYVGSENEHNIKSLNWFFNDVYPYLSEGIKICVIGKICDFIPDFENVTKINFVESIKTYYNVSKIAICPMLTGTGVKVKVVEAISYGLPIVCSERGLDGLPLKKNNGCLNANTSEDFANRINELLGNKNLYEETQRCAIEMFQQYFEKTKNYEKLDKIFDIRG